MIHPVIITSKGNAKENAFYIAVTVFGRPPMPIKLSAAKFATMAQGLIL